MQKDLVATKVGNIIVRHADLGNSWDFDALQSMAGVRHACKKKMRFAKSTHPRKAYDVRAIHTILDKKLVFLGSLAHLQEPRARLGCTLCQQRDTVELKHSQNVELG